MQIFYIKETNIVAKKKENRFKKIVEKLKGYSASKINFEGKRYTYKTFQTLFTKQCQNIQNTKLKEDI